MIRQLCGYRESADALVASCGKRIALVTLADDEARVAFDDGSTLALTDKGQSCCEYRYMRTDDTLAEWEGATLVDVEVRDAPGITTEYDEHEVQFLVIRTDRGDITFSSHNEHNGYYGGFSIEARVFTGAP